MWVKKIICMALVLMVGALAAQAATITDAWMEYEDYSDGRAEQSIENANNLQVLEQILLEAREHPAELDGCTLNCTLFVMDESGEIYDFACATDGCPYIVAGQTGKVYSLTDDYDDFWAIFSGVRDGMGFDASAFFDLDD